MVDGQRHLRVKPVADEDARKGGSRRGGGGHGGGGGWSRGGWVRGGSGGGGHDGGARPHPEPATHRLARPSAVTQRTAAPARCTLGKKSPPAPPRRGLVVAEAGSGHRPALPFSATTQRCEGRTRRLGRARGAGSACRTGAGPGAGGLRRELRHAAPAFRPVRWNRPHRSGSGQGRAGATRVLYSALTKTDVKRPARLTAERGIRGWPEPPGGRGRLSGPRRGKKTRKMKRWRGLAGCSAAGRGERSSQSHPNAAVINAAKITVTAAAAAGRRVTHRPTTPDGIWSSAP